MSQRMRMRLALAAPYSAAPRLNYRALAVRTSARSQQLSLISHFRCRFFVTHAAATTTPHFSPPRPPTAARGRVTGPGTEANVAPRSNRRRLVYIVLGFLTVFTVSGTVVAFSLPSNPINKFAYEVFVHCYALIRVGRDVVTATRMIGDYVWSLYGLEGEVRAVKLEECHWRNAVRLRDCFEANGGVYIKFGQHLALMSYLIPDAYCVTMQTMLHAAPTSPFSEVKSTIESSLGHPIDAIFDSLSPIPIASASLAQVHLGVLHNGEEVAVKVQHRFLRHTVDSDIKAVRFIVRSIHSLFPAFDYNWLADEMSQSLPKECDFRLEGANADRCRALFADRDDVLVPRIHWDYTSDRVLVMERMRGCMVTDVPAIRSLGLKPADVSELVSEVFSTMMFHHGFTHADPHSGNIFVAQHARHPHMPALVLLDHGLYSEISPEFRLLYCRLWRALITADKVAVKHFAEQCGAGAMHELFAAMLTRRPWNDDNNPPASALSSTANHAAPNRAQMQQWAAVYGLDIQKILATIPPPMILLLKTNECLRHIDSVLGTNYRAFVIMARACQREINSVRLRESSHSLRAMMDNVRESVAMESRILVFEALMTVHSLLQSIRLTLLGLLRPQEYRLFQALIQRVNRRRRRDLF